MKRAVSFIAACALIFLFTALEANAGKMDLPLQMLIGQPAAGKAILGKAVTEARGIELVDVLVKSSDPDLTAFEIEKSGGEVRSTIGAIMTAFVPVAYLEKIAARDEVQGIEASKKLRFLMDSARANTGVDRLQDGTADRVLYDGKNVVVGVIDSGLDFSRDDFKDSSGTTRVQYLRFQTATSGSVAITECVKSAVKDGSCAIAATNDSSVGHGTHVTGIAAGSNSTYKGNAPAADIMLVRNDFSDFLKEGTGTFSASLLDGVTEIFTKADVIDKAAVINISQGTHIGAHDNTSLIEQGIDNAVNGQYSSTGKSYGRVVVVAAGNENVVTSSLGTAAAVAGGIHGAFNVAAGTSKGFRLWVLSAPAITPLVIDVWFGTGEKNNCSITAKSYAAANILSKTLTTDNALLNFAADLPMSTDNSGASASTADNKVTAGIAVASSDSQNSRPRALVTFGPGTSGSWSDIIYNGAVTPATGYFFDVIIRAGSGGSCTGDLWLEGGGTIAHFLKGIDTGAFDVANGATKGNGYALKAGDGNKSVDIPGTASGVITVGAYLQEKPFGSGKSQWTSSSGVTFDATSTSQPTAAQVNSGTIGARTPFSSLGPPNYSYSGRKPDLLAPGDPIISTLATGHTVDAYLQVDATHFKSQGTSQATPQITGIIALLFQKNNTLTAAQVKNALISTASKSAAPDDSDGYGNVNAVAALASVATDTSGFRGTGDLNSSSSSSGGSSSGGCSSLIPAHASSTGADALFLVPIALIFRAWRRRIV